MNKLSKDASATLMIANLFSTILVVAIHYNTKASIDSASREGLNYLFQEFFANGIARVAVPFFALISGIFFVRSMLNAGGYWATVKQKVFTVLVPYLLASIFFFVCVSLFRFLVNKPPLEDYVLNILLHPLSGQLWFVRDLMLLILMSPVFFLLSNKWVCYFVLAFLGGGWMLDVQPFPIVGGWYLLNLETLFFFVCGGLLSRRLDLLNTIIFTTDSQKIVIFLIWIALIVLRVHIDPTLDVWYVKSYTAGSILLYKSAILVGLFSLLHMAFLFRNSESFLYLSGLTFFVFLFHLTPLNAFVGVTRKFVSEPYGFYLNFVIAVVVVFFVGHLTSKYFPRTYNLISGGRSPNKSLGRLA